jgi:hypothetical protein
LRYACILVETSSQEGAVWRDSWNTGIMEPEETAVAGERHLNTFLRQRTRDGRIENGWKRCFLLGPLWVCCGHEELWEGSQSSATYIEAIVGICYQATTGEDTADWECLVHAIMNCKVRELGAGS